MTSETTSIFDCRSPWSTWTGARHPKRLRDPRDSLSPRKMLPPRVSRFYTVLIACNRSPGVPCTHGCVDLWERCSSFEWAGCGFNAGRSEAPTCGRSDLGDTGMLTFLQHFASNVRRWESLDRFQRVSAVLRVNLSYYKDTSI